MSISEIFRPNQKINNNSVLALTVGWLAFMVAFWWGIIPHMSALIPGPVEVLNAGAIQWQQGAIYQMITSISISLSAIFFAAVIGLGLSYLSTIPFFKAPVHLIGSMRVLSLTGITIIFVLATPNGYWLKVSVLTFAIVVFLVNSMLQVIDDIPLKNYDHARTLGMSEWKILTEVVIRGTLASAFDTLRMNAAMAWMMLTMVEGMSRSDGGIGIVLLELSRQSNYAAIFSVQLLIFLVGIGQDRLVQFAKLMACPYTKVQ